MKKAARVRKTGSISPNFHEGSRSEYLAQFVFSSFGTAIPIPHQEDSGLDLYCTLLERQGQRAWPRSYYSVQVKSSIEPWEFDGPESVRWIIEHPLPIFLCIILKSEARVLVYHTTPRFAVWALPTKTEKLVLIPGRATDAITINWTEGHEYELRAPILDFTIDQLLDSTFHNKIGRVLQHWIDYDVENLFRIKSGIPRFQVPYNYRTNETEHQGTTEQGGPFRSDLLIRAESRLKELLGCITDHRYPNEDWSRSVICAMALRQLSPNYEPGEFTRHNNRLHQELNLRLGMQPPTYQYQACDALIRMIEDRVSDPNK
jgi:hypothetical protein